jgi:hypothetical protein
MSDEPQSGAEAQAPAGGTPAHDGEHPVNPPTPDPAALPPAYGEGDPQPGAEAAPPALTIAPPAADPARDARRATIHALVEEWWSDHMPGSVVGRSTEIWNYVHAAKEALKVKLDRWLGG